MKHMKRANIYKASNVTFNPETFEAFSYDWWQFVAKINGKVVFNTFNYSPSTCKHQSKVRSLLSTLGIKIDMFVECPAGFQASNMVENVKKHYSFQILELEQAINKPRSHKAKNEERARDMQALAIHSAKFVGLCYKINNKLNQKLYPKHVESGEYLVPVNMA